MKIRRIAQGVEPAVFAEWRGRSMSAFSRACEVPARLIRTAEASPNAHFDLGAFLKAVARSAELLSPTAAE